MAYHFFSIVNFVSGWILMQNLFQILHWIGLAMTMVMLVLSFLDQSRDEYIIHIIASSMPLVCIWIIRNFLLKSVGFSILKRLVLTFLHVKCTLLKRKVHEST